MRPELFEQIQELIKETQKNASNIAILAVINVKSLSKQLPDYPSHSIRTSFLNDWEIDEFVVALRHAGFYVQHFVDEEEFFSWVQSGGYSDLNIQHKLVYTSASNGIGPGRRALVPAFCNYHNIPTLNSNAYSCAINRHKFHVSKLLTSFGIKVPRTWYYLPNEGWWDNDSPPQGFKIIAKATYEGSSVGVESAAIGPYSDLIEERISELSILLRQPITVQELIEGYEIEVPVMRFSSHKALGAAILSLNGKSNLKDTVLLYDDAWEDAYSYVDVLALPSMDIDNIYFTAELAAKILDFEGISRIDFRVKPDGDYYVIDVSSTPHLTQLNAINYLFSQAGLEYHDMLTALVASGYFRHQMIYSSDQNSKSEARNPLP